MTIYTSTTIEKKDHNCDPPEVVVKNLPLLQLKSPQVVGDGDDTDGCLLSSASSTERLLLVVQQRRRRNVINLLLLLLTALLLAISLVIGISVYRGYQYKQNEYRGVCGVTYMDENRQYYEFEQEFRTDGKSYENIQVPEIDNFNRATILHDFDTNWTAIVDYEQKRCFIKPLNTTTTKQPKDFWDLIIKIRTGYYLPDEEEVKENYRVVMPPVYDVMKFGQYIGSNCWKYDTYELEKLPLAIRREKRDACPVFSVRHSTGVSVITMNIAQC